MTNKYADILRGLVATDCERLGVPGSADAAREAADEIERLDKKCAVLEFLRDNPQVKTSIADEPECDACGSSDTSWGYLRHARDCPTHVARLDSTESSGERSEDRAYYNGARQAESTAERCSICGSTAGPTSSHPHLPGYK